MNATLEIQLIAALTAAACAIPGVFLVLRKMALISDAISHSILPGIVIGFFITHDLASPWLILFATISGVITVVLVELVQNTRLVKEDTAIGLVFPVLFSIGVILIALNANDVHLDVDAVLLGDLAFAPFDRLLIDSIDYGPKGLWMISGILSITICLLVCFYKELKLSTFDVGLSSALGFAPVVVHYGLMSVASVTTVAAFDAVGAILVVAMMIAPAAAAYLLTERLKRMLWISIGIGVGCSLGGYWVARLLDASIAGSITSVLGVVFLSIYFFAPSKGLIAVTIKQNRQRIEVSLLTFLLHLNNHESKEERHVAHLQEHINWQRVRANSVLKLAQKNNLILIENQVVSLTEKGKQFTEKALHYIITNEDEQIEDMKDDFFLFRG